MVPLDRERLNKGSSDGLRVILLAPVSMHETPYYAAVLEEIERRQPDAHIVADEGLFDGLADWKANWKARLKEINPTDLYVIAALDGTVGRGVYEMYLALFRSGVRCRAALFPVAPGEPFEVIENFELRVVDSEDWRHHAVPVAAGGGEGTPTGSRPLRASRQESTENVGQRRNPGPVCVLCEGRIDEAREPYTVGRGKSIIGPEYAGLIVAVHDRCTEFDGLTEGQWADEEAGF